MSDRTDDIRDGETVSEARAKLETNDESAKLRREKRARLYGELPSDAKPEAQQALDVAPVLAPPLGISSLTEAQALTLDKLADNLGELCQTLVRSELVPDANADESGTMLAILTADSPGDDPVTRVWSSSGRSCYPVASDGRYGPRSFESALAYIRADGLSAIVQRASSLVFQILPGGAYELRRYS